MKRPFSRFFGLVLAIFTLSSAASFAQGSTLNRTDKTFVKAAYEDGLAQIRLAEIGQARALNSEVKVFAAQIVLDHTKTNADLKALGEVKRVELPNASAAGTDRKANFLDGKSGNEFDKSFVETMLADHKKAVIDFEKAAVAAKDADVKEFAAQMVPTLKGHLAMAEELQKRLGK